MRTRPLAATTLLGALLALGLATPARPQAAAAPAKPAILKPGDNLLTDGLPDIPAEIAEAVGRYTEFRSASFAGWHPVKREMLISTRFGDTPQVHEVKVPGGARRQLTFFPDRVGGASWPRRSAEYIVFDKDRGGDEFSQIFRLDVATGAIAMISDGGRSQNYLGPWSHAGDRMAFGSTRRNGADRDVYVMDPRDPATTRRVLEVKGGGWGPTDWSPDDTRLLVIEGISVNESYVWVVDVATGEKTLLTPRGGPEKVAYSGPRWSADGRGIYVTTDRDSEFERLAHLDVATGKHTTLTAHIPWDVQSFALSPDGKTIAFETNEEGLSVLHLLDTATGMEKPAPKTAGRPHRWPRVAQQRPRPRPRPHVSPLPVRRLLPRRRRRDARALDGERDGRPQRAGLLRAGARALEELRREDDLRVPLQARGPLHRPAAGHRQHPRRARGPVAPGLPGPEQLLPRRARRRRPLPERPRLHRLRQDLPEARQRHAARGLGEGHRRAPGLDPHPAGPRRRRA